MLLRPTEVARELNVSTRTVLRLIRDGELEGVRIRKVWRVPRGSFERFKARLLKACAAAEAENSDPTDRTE